ncbi:hypothetical protein I317_07469 [Kwoniella heveanensis CBS 569]|nr:hypothetical protein I317_07469 [Kwoniella heveanensis CBS 569]
MAPSGLVISKLGVQATAADDQVKGLLCLKISLPREIEGRPGARWALFSSNPPPLTCTPSIFPLPLPLPASRLPPCKLASKLLSLPLPTSYPPSPQTPLGEKPYIDVSSTTGKIAVVMDPSPSVRRRGSSIGTSGSGGGSSSTTRSGRRDWLVCMEFQVDLESGVEEAISKVLLPLPKCLDNVIRFQIISPSNSTGEVSILTDPKMLPLPSSAFSRPLPQKETPSASPAHNAKGKDRAIIGEEGWEDGEDLGPEDLHSDEESEPDPREDDSDECGGCWLEGRFQSTDMLRLEWSYNPPSGSEEIPSLQISPIWDKRQPSISLVYTAVIGNMGNPAQLEVDVPDDWAWSDVTIQGQSLTSWVCVDGGWKAWDNRDPDETLDGAEYDDSFATIRARRAGNVARRNSQLSNPSPFPPPATGSSSAASSSASLMRQTFPAPVDMKMEDYSFELSASMAQQKPTTPATLRRSPSATNPMLASSTRSHSRGIELKIGRVFDLYFDEDSVERTVVFQGTLVPNSGSILVSPSLPMKIPFVILNGQRDTQGQLQCPSAHYGTATQPTSDVELVNISQGGSFCWTDDQGQPLPLNRGLITGDVRLKLRRSVWGTVAANIAFSFPRQEDELGFSIPYQPGGEVKLSRATIDGISIAKAVYDTGSELNIRLGRRENRNGGAVAVELEILPAPAGVVTLPVFEGKDGDVQVAFVGEEWTSLFEAGFNTNLQPSPASLYAFTYPRSSTEAPAFTLPNHSATSPALSTRPNKSRSRTLFSFSTLLNLFLIWLIISMGQQIQRLRSEVAFVVDETRDLRMYGLGHTHTTGSPAPSTSGADIAEVSREIVQSASAAQPITADASSSTSTTTVVEPRIDQDSTLPVTAPTERPLAGNYNLDRRNDEVVLQEEKKANFPLGRVVWGVERGWEKWISHPT